MTIESTVTLDEAAKLLDCARSTLNAWIARGKLPVVRMSYKHVRVRLIDIEKAKERHLSTGPCRKRRQKTNQQQ